MLSREVVESHSLEVFKEKVDGFMGQWGFRDMVFWAILEVGG